MQLAKRRRPARLYYARIVKSDQRGNELHETLECGHTNVWTPRTVEREIATLRSLEIDGKPVPHRLCRRCKRGEAPRKQKEQ